MAFNKTLVALTVAALSTGLTACGGGSSSSDPEPTPTPTPPANAAPTNVTLSNASVDENTNGAVVGTLSAVDADSGDTHTFTVEGDTFVINGNELSIASGVFLDVDADDAPDSLTANVTATDNSGAAVTIALEVTINDVADRYAFDSKLNSGESSVSYTGQIARHILIKELNKFISSDLQTQLDDGTITTRQEVLDGLNTYFRTSEVQYPDLPITFIDNSAHALISEISSSHKDLLGKVAGNDQGGQHKDWTVDGVFVGWGSDPITPEGLIDALFEQLADNAEEVLSGASRTDANGNDIPVYVNTNGVDLRQMIEKFLLMSVTYSQGTDDYFGEDTEGKGLLTSNVGPQSAGNPYTRLEHQFDEGYGYFGGAVNYLEYNDNELSGKVSSDDDGRSAWNGSYDINGDGSIDLRSEYNFGQSVNAAKRDRGTASNTAPTDLTKQAMDALIAGRTLINDNVDSELTEAQQTELSSLTATAVDAWEKAIAATVIHYINDTSADLANAGTADFNHLDAAKHFSEMKGFALGLQFNERKQISDADFATLHTLMGDAPVLTGDVAGYISDLEDARDILQAAYSFDAENVSNW